MKLNADIIIVGSGVGGATLAKELTKKGRKVLILEKGDSFSLKDIGSEFRAFKFYDKYGLWSKSKEGVFYYRTIMVGGTSIVSCGNGVRSLEIELKNLGIDLSQEFIETEKELKVAPVPDKFLGKGTRAIMEAANKLGFNMVPMPKLINFDKCVSSCEKCVVGCCAEAKWTALNYLKQAQEKGTSLMTEINVKRVLISDSRAIGVEGNNNKGEKIEVYAESIILAAGGLGTPVILQNSGIKAGEKLFLDLFNVTLGLIKDEGSAKELTMAAVHHNDGFILSPFVDCKLALAAILPFRHILKIAQQKNMLGIMTKIKDDREGKINKNGAVEKTVTQSDFSKLRRGSDISKEILIKAGVDPKSIAVTNIRGAHPGGTAAINEVVNTNLETQIKGLFVCDASVFPETPGLPPIVTIVALAKRFAKNFK